MTKAPEVVLCDVTNDDTSPTIITYVYDLETRLISAADKSVPPTGESTLIESISYDSAGNLVTSGKNEPSVAGDRYKFVSREWNSETALQYNRTTLRAPIVRPSPPSQVRHIGHHGEYSFHNAMKRIGFPCRKSLVYIEVQAGRGVCQCVKRNRSHIH
jgi:hypothetical protein